MQDVPFFIVGTERSGSNLLRLILDSHPRIVIPHPPHVMRYFSPLVAHYGDLHDPQRFRALVDDVLALVHAHIHPWPSVPNAEAVIARCEQRDLLAVYGAVHELARDASGKARWGCKSTFMMHHADAVLERWPDARLLWLYRDPRDVAASSRESVFSTFHPAYTARLWSGQQTLGLAVERAHPANTLRIRYESLVAAPELEVRRICEFLGEEFHPKMLQWFKGAEAKRSAGLSESWSNTAAPMREDRLERWRRDLAVADVKAVESIAGVTMAALDYERVTPASSAAATGFTELRWWFVDRWLWAKVELRSMRRDKNVWRRWKRAMLLWRIRARLALRGT